MASSNAPLARASLDSSKHPSVDAFLKSLKLHTRKLSVLLSQHATELAVLERIYYINNNQHRAAIFWKRVVEARRYSRRLKSCDVSSLISDLRVSFYGNLPDTGSKPHKGAWSHYASASSLKSFLARLRTCIALLDKTCVRMGAIYSVLTLAMRSGAFLHLVVTLTALVARLAHLSSALRIVLSALHAESTSLLDTLHPTEATHKATSLPPPPPPPLDAEEAGVSGISRMVLDSDLDMSTDLGEAVARPPTDAPQPGPRWTSPTVLDLPLPMHGAGATPAPISGPRQPAVAGNAPPTALQPLVLGPSLRPAVVVKRRDTAPEEPRQKKRIKAKKTQRDEIDDIFS